MTYTEKEIQEDNEGLIKWLKELETKYYESCEVTEYLKKEAHSDYNQLRDIYQELIIRYGSGDAPILNKHLYRSINGLLYVIPRYYL